MATFQAQVTGLTNITISSSGTNPIESQLSTFLTDGAKEIINIMPPELKRKAVTASILDDSPTTYDMDGGGEVLNVTRLSANSDGFYIPCREIPPMYGDLTNDSSSLYHATVTDPVYWVTSTAGGVSTLFVKPTTTANQPANVYHIAYPTVAYSEDTIANFPNEAEYLVVLYAAIKTLQNAMGAMDASIIHSDQDGSYSASSASSQGWEKVRDLLHDEEDTELASATASSLSAEMQQFIAEYQWMQGQQAKLNKDYDTGVTMLMTKGNPEPREEAK